MTKRQRVAGAQEKKAPTVTRLSLWIPAQMRHQIADLARQERRSVNKQSELLLEQALAAATRAV